MSNIDSREIVHLVIIASRKQKEELLVALGKSGVRLINTVYGKGTVKASYLRNVLGLVPEVDKAVIIGLVRREKVDGVLHLLLTQFKFDQPNTGVAFTIPINQFSSK